MEGRLLRVVRLKWCLVVVDEEDEVEVDEGDEAVVDEGDEEYQHKMFVEMEIIVATFTTENVERLLS
jgi:hypothetical protein